MISNEKPNYSDRMRCYVVGIPRIEKMNGHGSLKISTIISPDPETALRSYLTRETPERAGEIIEYLMQRNATLSEFAIHAPSHDICFRGRYSAEQLREQNARISKTLALICDRDIEEVRETVARLLQ